MNNIMKTVKSLKESGLLIKGVSEKIRNEAKEQKGGILIIPSLQSNIAFSYLQLFPVCISQYFSLVSFQHILTINAATTTFSICTGDIALGYCTEHESSIVFAPFIFIFVFIFSLEVYITHIPKTKKTLYIIQLRVTPFSI